MAPSPSGTQASGSHIFLVCALIVAVLLGFTLGIVATCGYFAVHDPQNLLAYGHSVALGFCIGIGVAFGFTLLNLLVGGVDFFKNKLGF